MKQLPSFSSAGCLGFSLYADAMRHAAGNQSLLLLASFLLLPLSCSSSLRNSYFIPYH